MDASFEALRAQFASRYHLERELGRGGMGAVYLARDLRLDRPVALKVLPAEYASDTGLRDRFLRETRMAASFSHPNIVPVYSVEDAGDTLAFAMGFVDGESLADRVRRTGPLPVRDVVRLLQDVCYALAYAHGRGVVHRDLKPDNIMIEKATRRALLMDFGISRTISAPAAGTAALTRVGEVVGTPQYMSPEQATGDTVDGRSDLYALALVAHFALTATVVMDGTTTQQILVRQLTETVPSVRTLRPDVPAALDAAMAQCLAKDPADRFADAGAVLEAIDAMQEAAPDVPVGIRLFAQEARGLSRAGLLLLVVSVPVVTSIIGNSDQSVWDAVVPTIFVGAIVVARLLRTRQDAQELVRDGWSAREVHDGVRRSMDELHERAAARRADPRARDARRRTVLFALAQAGVAALLIAYFFSQRVAVGPHQYRIISFAGIVAGYLGLAALGVSLWLLARSPLRVSLLDRAFSALWRSGIGRWLVGPDAAPAAASAGPRATPAARVTTGGGTASAAIDLAALERRVSALEAAQRPPPAAR